MSKYEEVIGRDPRHMHNDCISEIWHCYIVGMAIEEHESTGQAAGNMAYIDHSIDSLDLPV